MWKERLQNHPVLRRLFGEVDGPQRRAWVDHAIFVYAGVVLVTYVLFMIAPVVTLLAPTPLYHIKTYLGILGAGLILLDWFTNKGIWRGDRCWLLYGVCAAAVVSSLLTVSYGVKDNLYDLCWLVIQFALFYSWARRGDRRKLERNFKVLFGVLLGIWLVACCVSIYQYVFQIGYTYISNPNTSSPEITRQGFYQNRLFGVFVGLDYAVYLSLILSICCIHYLATTRRGWTVRAPLLLCVGIFLVHMILSGSRSVQVALLLYVFFLTLLLLRGRLSQWPRLRRACVCVVASVCAAAIGVGCFVGLKGALAKVPALISSEPQDQNQIQEPIEGQEPAAPGEDILERQGLEDISNDRFKIWRDYLGLYREIGLFGLSLSNYNDYISDRHPDLYIVRYFQEKYGESEKSDLVYECHNNYLFAFVSTGAVGALLLGIFLILMFARVLRFIWRHPRAPMNLITPLAIVGVGFVEALFMNSVLLKINGLSFIFWLALGVVMKVSEGRADPGTRGAV